MSGQAVVAGGPLEECCCTIPSDGTAVACPRSGGPARRVPWKTVAALVDGPVPPHEPFHLCPDADCAVVYFGAGGVFEAANVRALPWWKRGSGEVLCHCFGLDRAALEAEVVEGGDSPSVDAIREATAAGRCACDVRNPAGHCCLAELGAAVREARERTTQRERRAR